MCLYTHEAVPSIAKEDIIVYKVISENNKSAMYRFQYEPNKLYRLRKALKCSISIPVIEEGFHSFSNFSSAKYDQNFNGYHGKMKIVEFIIPKGARYFISIEGETIVSSSIRSGDLTHIQHLKDTF